MDVNPNLYMFVFAALIIVALLIIAYWVAYTRRLKTSSRLGKTEGIALATEERERRGNPRHAA